MGRNTSTLHFEWLSSSHLTQEIPPETKNIKRKVVYILYLGDFSNPLDICWCSGDWSASTLAHKKTIYPSGDPKTSAVNHTHRLHY